MRVFVYCCYFKGMRIVLFTVYRMMSSRTCHRKKTSEAWFGLAPEQVLHCTIISSQYGSEWRGDKAFACLPQHPRALQNMKLETKRWNKNEITRMCECENTTRASSNRRWHPKLHTATTIRANLIRAVSNSHVRPYCKPNRCAWVRFRSAPSLIKCYMKKIVFKYESNYSYNFIHYLSNV